MGWRIHLTNQAIQYLHILTGRQPVLVVWTRPDRPHFYDLETGTTLIEKKLPTPTHLAYHAQTRQSEAWYAYLAELNGLDEGVYLPYVRLGQLDIHTTDDGKLRVYHMGNQVDIAIDNEEASLPIDADDIVTLALDRALGTIALLDARAHLHIFQQNLPIGTFDVGLSTDDDARLQLAISRGGGSIFLSDGRQLLNVDINGEVNKRLETHYFIGQVACSPAGGMLLTHDSESGVLRVYHGESLTPTHQKFAIDLVAHATQVQLLADLPPTDTTLSTLVAHNRGTIAFAMAGVVCVSDIREMDELPRARKLF